MIIHARQCVLHGLSPAQNRSIPPLNPELVHQLVATFPDMKFVLNGGIVDFMTAKQHLGRYSNHVDQFIPQAADINARDSGYVCSDDFDYSHQPSVHGVMIGREAYNHPFHFSTADSEFYFKKDLMPSRWEVVEEYVNYAQSRIISDDYSRCCTLVKPLHNVFHGSPTNHSYKQKLDYLIKKHSKNVDKGEIELMDVIMESIQDTIPQEVLEKRGYSVL